MLSRRRDDGFSAEGVQGRSSASPLSQFPLLQPLLRRMQLTLLSSSDLWPPFQPSTQTPPGDRRRSTSQGRTRDVQPQEGDKGGPPGPAITAAESGGSGSRPLADAEEGEKQPVPAQDPWGFEVPGPRPTILLI